MVESLGAALRRARRRAGLTLNELAVEVGVSQATLSRAETGRGRLTAERLRLCAGALGVQVEDLLRQDSDEMFEIADDFSIGIRGLFSPGAAGAWRHYDDLELPPAMSAALDSFLELGYHGTSVRDIARLANLSVPGLYHHYPSKHSLLVAVMEMLMDDFHARCVAARADGADTMQRFTLLVECFALFHSYRRELAFIGASEMRSLEEPDRRRIAEVRNSCQRMVDEEVRAMAEENLIDGTFSEDASRAVVTMLVGIANWYNIKGPLTPEEIARRYVAHSSAIVRLAEAPVLA